MTPKQVIEAALGERFQPEGEEPYTLELRPGLSEAEFREFAARFPHPLPPEIEELLRFTRGFDFGSVDPEVDFTGRLDFEDADVFPHGAPIAGDGCGNFWVVDVNPESGAWAPVFYACHDPPVIVYQSASLAEFLEELFNIERPGRSSQIEYVHEDASMDIWRNNPDLIPAPEARQSADGELRAFAKSLDDRALISDLRAGKVGSGFSWGRYGADTPVRRDGARLLFGIMPPERRPGFFQRLFGR